MRRVLRILLNAATVLSLVIFAATTVLGVRSVFREDQIDWESVGDPSGPKLTDVQYIARSGRGVLALIRREQTGS